ncbi:MAG: hypothetical protein Q8N05_05710 [Bacteroidota bacterium]|nr:hypothetical protein [Bacteroidota bacterium]
MKTINEKIKDRILCYDMNELEASRSEIDFRAGVRFAQQWISIENDLPEILPQNKSGIIENKDLLLLKVKKHDSLEFGVLRKNESQSILFWDIPDKGSFTLTYVTEWRPIERQ